MLMFANRIGSSTSCSIWLPETSPPSFPRGTSSVTGFKVATLPFTARSALARRDHRKDLLVKFPRARPAPNPKLASRRVRSEARPLLKG
jgi:hypothetical protein